MNITIDGKGEAALYFGLTAVGILSLQHTAGEDSFLLVVECNGTKFFPIPNKT
jgi:hypothetical protein